MTISKFCLDQSRELVTMEEGLRLPVRRRAIIEKIDQTQLCIAILWLNTPQRDRREVAFCVLGVVFSYANTTI
jgi:hypothetical protein